MSRGSAGPVRANRPRLVLLVVALLASVFAAYAGCLDHEFLSWDDPYYVTQNSLVLHRDYAALLTTIVSSNYHPLTMVSLAVNVGTPLSPKLFLLTNVALHALNTVLVYFLVLLLSRGRVFVSFWVALLFGIHPMHVESVAWISERKDVLYTAFLLAAAITYWRYLESRASTWLVITLVLFVLSCLSKGMAVVFPLLMVLLDFWRGRSILERRALAEKAPFFATALLFGLVAVNVQAGGDFHGLLTRSDPGVRGLATAWPYSTLQRAVLPTYGFFMYLWRLFVPVNLGAFYPYPAAGAPLGARYLLPPFFALALVALALWDIRRSRVLAFGVGWYVATILPVIQWIPVGEAIMADRYAYLSYVGPLFALGMGASALAARAFTWRAGVSAACVAFAAFLFVCTVRQVEVWASSETLWSNVIRLYPRNDRGYLARGSDRGSAGRTLEAMADLRTARALGSQRGSLYDGLGNAFGTLGQNDSALVMFDRGLALEPNMGRTHYNRAVVYLRLGRPAEALADLDRARALLPTQTLEFHVLRGDAYLQMKRYREAAAEYDGAIRDGFGNAPVFSCRAYCRAQFGDSAGAAEDLREARRLSADTGADGTANP